MHASQASYSTDELMVDVQIAVDAGAARDPIYQAFLDFLTTDVPREILQYFDYRNIFIRFSDAAQLDANTQSLGTTAGANLIPGQPTQYLPGLSFASSKVGGQLKGPFAFGTTDGPEIFHQTSIQFSDTATWIKKAHTMRMGFQFNRYRNNYVPATSSDGAAGRNVAAKSRQRSSTCTIVSPFSKLTWPDLTV